MKTIHLSTWLETPISDMNPINIDSVCNININEIKWNVHGSTLWSINDEYVQIEVIKNYFICPDRSTGESCIYIVNFIDRGLKYILITYKTNTGTRNDIYSIAKNKNNPSTIDCITNILNIKGHYNFFAKNILEPSRIVVEKIASHEWEKKNWIW